MNGERNVNTVASAGKVRLCDVYIDRLSMSDVVARISATVESGGELSISMVNVAKVVSMRSDAQLRESVESSDLVLADGMPLIWLSRLVGEPLPERVAGIDLMYNLFALAHRRALRVFLLGAKEEALSRVVEAARRDYPGMVIAGYRDGYFAESQEREVARSVRHARPDILLVAMSSPKKEVFLRRWGQFMRVAVCHGVGGSFDVMAGLTRRAPRWMQRVGLEWFFRMIQEPRRMWKRYLVTNSVFVILALRAIVRRRRSCGGAVGAG